MALSVSEVRFVLSVCLLAALTALPCAAAAGRDAVDPANFPPPPANAPGFPSRSPDLDALPGFVNPPSGYGEIPFWWWSGAPLDKQRLLWQLDQLHAKGISGVQVNYAHDGRLLTLPAEPPIFSDAWWEIWTWITAEFKKRNMGIGLSGYTLDWPGRKDLFYEKILIDPALRGMSLGQRSQRAEGGKPLSWKAPEDTVAVVAMRLKDGAVEPGSEMDLTARVRNGTVAWTPPPGQWQLMAFSAPPRDRTLDPMNPAAGKTVIEKFFQPFVAHCPGGTDQALNYFFQDELGFGVGGWLWTARLPEEFRKRKGYDLLPALPALFTDVGPRTPKIRMDYCDVMVALEEENYFRPIFAWNYKRGMIYACDPGSRGKNPSEFGDYFRCVRWYTAPGHDTPGSSADLIKNKVSSSIAHLYLRPRVWLEGYHSLGWGATPATIAKSSQQNFVYGASLLNLHGLYYTTHGGFWEWTPPCYHFRMPYWDHMAGFLKYFERLSYLLSQGVHRCDVAIMYPVAPGDAGMGGQEATNAAFGLGSTLSQQGIDFDFLDFQSLARAEVRHRQLQVSGESYRVLVLPAMAAIRWSSIEQALAFYRAGGIVIAIGCLPEASDRAGRDDPQLDAAVKELFGLTAKEAKEGKAATPQKNAAGGLGVAVLGAKNPAPHPAAAPAMGVAEIVTANVPRDFVPDVPCRVLHRKVGPRDVFMVMDAPKNAECFFRAKGKVELWDPWTGKTSPILTRRPDGEGTRVRLPLEEYEARLIVFSPGDSGAAVEKTDLDEVTAVEAVPGGVAVKGFAATAGKKRATVRQGGQTIELEGDAPAPLPPMAVEGLWGFELKPTLDNRWGDYRMPATPGFIGAEARQFRYAEETGAGAKWYAADFDDSRWPVTTCAFGPRFWRLGPVPAGVDAAAIEGKIATLVTVNPATPVEGKLAWKPYEYSVRWGIEGDPGAQDGHHGLKKHVTDYFILLGSGKEPWGNGMPEEGSYWAALKKANDAGDSTVINYLWAAVVAAKEMKALVLVGANPPHAVWLNGAPLPKGAETLPLRPGVNRLLLKYVGDVRGSFVLVDAAAPKEGGPRTPLSMTWYDKPGVMRYDPKPSEMLHVGWYRFTSPPGLRAMKGAAHGKVRAWAGGKELAVEQGGRLADGTTAFKATIARPEPGTVNVALRIEQEPGYYAGAAIPEPIALDCGTGQMALGDWSKVGVLATYSGGAWYRKKITLSPEQVRGRVTLQLGSVVATAEVRVNGQVAGIRVAPPWNVEITPFVKAGENQVEILIYSTLSNHYTTIPTKYRGQPTAGLIGPVTIEVQSPVVLLSPALSKVRQ